MNGPWRILFASPYCLLDTTNGAALATRELLDELARCGFLCAAVTAPIMDPTHEVSLDKMLARLGSGHTACPASDGGPPIIEVVGADVGHTILKTVSSQRELLSLQEENVFISLVEKKIREIQPDILLTYGGLSAERRIHRLAREKGISVVFYLHNSLYTKAVTFSEVDLILVPSKFLSQFYEQRLGLRCRVLHPLFTNDQYRVKNRVPRFITFLNPTPLKGLTLFFKLAEKAIRDLPGAEFLVVEGRGTQGEAIRRGIRIDRLPNVKVIPHQQDVRTAYSVTRVLLYPSFWVEAFGRTIVEAQLNGIPVLASQRGGISEALNGGGFLLNIPERCTRNYMAVPTPEEVQPWVDRLSVLLQDEGAYEEAGRRAVQAAEDFSAEKIVERAAELFEALLKGHLTPRASEEGTRLSGQTKKIAKESSGVPLIRSPAVAGQFYFQEREKLRSQISDLLEISPVSLVVSGVVVPHAGYSYSGRIAGKVYGRIHIPERVILLGPNHTGRGKRAAIMSGGEWETPLGRVAVDSGLAEKLLVSCSLLEEDAEAHRGEHSLEVQLPFLSYLHPGVRIVPVALKRLLLEECLQMGQDIGRVVKHWPGTVLLVASTDLTHYQPRARARENDRLAIDQMLAVNPEDLYQTVAAHQISMCGVIPTTVVLAVCRELGVKQAQLIAYGDSGEINQDTKRVVGYGGLILGA